MSVCVSVLVKMCMLVIGIANMITRKNEAVELKEEWGSDSGCIDGRGIICDFTVARMAGTLASTSPFSAAKWTEICTQTLSKNITL